MMMKAAWVVALIAAAAVAGCMAEPANPSLAAPKLVVAARPDGTATVFIHSAFSERAYDWITITLDNETSINRTETFSLEEVLPLGFFLDAQAGWKDEVYQLRGRVDIFTKDARASVTLMGAEGKWASEPESFGLPYQHLLERRSN